MFIPEARYWWSRKRKGTDEKQSAKMSGSLCKLSYGLPDRGKTAGVVSYIEEKSSVFPVLKPERSFWYSLPSEDKVP